MNKYSYKNNKYFIVQITKKEKGDIE